MLLEIFLHQPQRQFDLPFRRLLCLLLESVEQHDKPSLSKATEDAMDVAARIGPELIQSLLPFDVRQELLRYPFRMGHQAGNMVDLLHHFVGEPGEEFLEMMPSEYQFANLVNPAKLTYNGT